MIGEPDHEASIRPIGTSGIALRSACPKNQPHAEKPFACAKSEAVHSAGRERSARGASDAALRSSKRRISGSSAVSMSSLPRVSPQP